MATVENFKNKLSNSISLKLLVITFLLLLLQIPLSYVRGLIYERQTMQSEAQSSISQRWGGSQQIGAPLLAVKYQKKKLVKDKNGEEKTAIYNYVNQIMAESFKANIELDAHKRYLGIYEFPVFLSKVKLQGLIQIQPSLHLGQDKDWAIQKLFIPISEMRGLKSVDKLLINGRKVTLSQQQPSFTGLSGLNVDLHQFKQQTSLSYEIDLTLSGSNLFEIIPMAGQTNIKLRSNWPSPSFIGDFLPAEREINTDGFSASWQVNELNHNLGRVIKDGEASHVMQKKPTLGFKVLIPANTYQVNQRTVKYGLLVMLLTFAGFFLAEMFFKLKLHPFQYILIGFSLSVFYLLLLSLSEYLRFEWSFLIAAIAITGLISGYCSVVLQHRKRGILTGVLFALLYAFIYVLVRAEQLSLLMGSIGIWLFLAAVMYLTRKIDWYSVNKTEME